MNIHSDVLIPRRTKIVGSLKNTSRVVGALLLCSSQVYTVILTTMGPKKGYTTPVADKKPNKSQSIVSKGKPKVCRQHRCICEASEGWCKDASDFFLRKDHPSKGFFKLRKVKKEKETRKEAIAQIQRHLKVTPHQWYEGPVVYIARHHYRPDHLDFVLKNARSVGIIKRYDVGIMQRLKHTTLRTDAFKGGKYLILPSQTQEEVAAFKLRLEMVPRIKERGEISTGGSSLTSGGPRVGPKCRSEVRRQSRDVAEAIDMLEAEGEDIYGTYKGHDYLDGEVEEEDEEENSGTLTQQLEAATSVLD